jgi:hypothetical protein
MNTMLRRLTPTIMCLSLLTGLYLVPGAPGGAGGAADCGPDF